MSNNVDTVLDQLEATPEILRLLMAGLTDDEARWKPAPGRFSVAEILEHLSHLEGHAYRFKIDLMIGETDPDLPAYDTDHFVAAGQYSGRDPEESFAHFEEQRQDNVDYLRSLDAGFENRTGNHAVRGRITLAHMLNEWACHDLGHIRQVAELVRAIRFYPHMGPYREAYQLKP